jgi:hypothetical protein
MAFRDVSAIHRPVSAVASPWGARSTGTDFNAYFLCATDLAMNL